jgi:hypothetical protein
MASSLLLSGTPQPAAHAVAGFDTDTALTASTAACLFAAGFRFCVRYVSPGSPSPQDLTFAEGGVILRAGLALMAVQHVRGMGWRPSQQSGQADGANAAANARSAGIPPDVTVWLDLEGINASEAASGVSAYAEDWFHSVQTAGYVPGLYAGAGAILDGQQLMALPFQHYWRSASVVPEIPGRGYQMLQSQPVLFQSAPCIDIDFLQQDLEGCVPWWLAPEQNENGLPNPCQ